MLIINILLLSTMAGFVLVLWWLLTDSDEKHEPNDGN
jgi:hypothetical protein